MPLIIGSQNAKEGWYWMGGSPTNFQWDDHFLLALPWFYSDNVRAPTFCQPFILVKWHLGDEPYVDDLYKALRQIACQEEGF